MISRQVIPLLERLQACRLIKAKGNVKALKYAQFLEFNFAIYSTFSKCLFRG